MAAVLARDDVTNETRNKIGSTAHRQTLQIRLVFEGDFAGQSPLFLARPLIGYQRYGGLEMAENKDISTALSGAKVTTR